jgi:hypothetical protein
LACALLAKAVLDLKTTRALTDRRQADSKLRRLCGFDLRFALPSEATFSRDSTAIEARESIAKKDEASSALFCVQLLKSA